jgi:hypothetical protein
MEYRCRTPLRDGTGLFIDASELLAVVTTTSYVEVIASSCGQPGGSHL